MLAVLVIAAIVVALLFEAALVQLSEYFSLEQFESDGNGPKM